MLRSVRAKLTVTTMLVMGCLLAALGFVVYFGAERTLLNSVDTDLRHRADSMADPHGPMGGPPRDRPPPGERQDTNGPNPPPMRANQPGLRPRMIPINEDGKLALRFDKPYDVDLANRAIQGWSGYTVTIVDDEPVRLYTRARVEQGRVQAVIQVPYGLGDIQKSLSNLRTVLLTLVIPLGVVLSGVASLFLVRRLTKPLHDLTVKAAEVSSHNLNDRLPVTGEDEFAALAITLNEMLGRLQLGFEQEQEAKRQLEESIAQQRRFTADASHELKTPLAVIKANAGLVLHMAGSLEDTRESVQGIDEAADRMNRLVADLLVLARVDGGQLSHRFEKCDLGEIVTTAIRQVPGAEGRVELKSTPKEVYVFGSKDDLPRVFVNLIDNALRYSEGKVSVEIGRRDQLACVEIHDSGAGIAPEHLEHLFERFYRVDKSRTSETGGTGLGLAICDGLVKAHGGRIQVASSDERGTSFTVELPLIAD